jgi:hypothetical protein
LALRAGKRVEAEFDGDPDGGWRKENIKDEKAVFIYLLGSLELSFRGNYVSETQVLR